MPSFRAREFFGRNIKSPQDIAAAGVEIITQILVRNVVLVFQFYISY